MQDSAVLSSTQIKITLPSQLQKHVKNRASRYGLTVSTYIKHLVLADVKSMEVPTFQMSETNEVVAENAIREHAEKKTHKITDVDEFLDNL